MTGKSPDFLATNTAATLLQRTRDDFCHAGIFLSETQEEEDEPTLSSAGGISSIPKMQQAALSDRLRKYVTTAFDLVAMTRRGWVSNTQSRFRPTVHITLSTSRKETAMSNTPNEPKTLFSTIKRNIIGFIKATPVRILARLLIAALSAGIGIELLAGTGTEILGHTLAVSQPAPAGLPVVETTPLWPWWLPIARGVYETRHVAEDFGHLRHYWKRAKKLGKVTLRAVKRFFGG